MPIEAVNEVTECMICGRQGGRVLVFYTLTDPEPLQIPEDCPPDVIIEYRLPTSISFLAPLCWREECHRKAPAVLRNRDLAAIKALEERWKTGGKR